MYGPNTKYRGPHPAPAEPFGPKSGTPWIGCCHAPNQIKIQIGRFFLLSFPTCLPRTDGTKKKKTKQTYLPCAVLWLLQGRPVAAPSSVPSQQDGLASADPGAGQVLQRPRRPSAEPDGPQNHPGAQTAICPRTGVCPPFTYPALTFLFHDEQS